MLLNGIPFAAQDCMRVLEVRFRQQLDGPQLIVGHLIWLGSLDREPALVRPAPALQDAGAPDAFLAKLTYLVSRSAPECFARLQQLRSRFWSFVEVAPAVLRDASRDTAAR
jgi:hypothetical protein